MVSGNMACHVASDKRGFRIRDVEKWDIVRHCQTDAGGATCDMERAQQGAKPATPSQEKSPVNAEQSRGANVGAEGWTLLPT